jgi:hypothetical protein
MTVVLFANGRQAEQRTVGIAHQESFQLCRELCGKLSIFCRPPQSFGGNATDTFSGLSVLNVDFLNGHLMIASL